MYHSVSFRRAVWSWCVCISCHKFSISCPGLYASGFGLYWSFKYLVFFPHLVKIHYCTYHKLKTPKCVRWEISAIQRRNVFSCMSQLSELWRKLHTFINGHTSALNFLLSHNYYTTRQVHSMIAIFMVPCGEKRSCHMFPLRQDCVGWSDVQRERGGWSNHFITADASLHFICQSQKNLI